MSQPLSWLAILFILGAGQGAFLSLSLLTNRVGSYAANRYLAALILVFTIALFDYFLDLTGLSNKYVELTILLWPKEFFYGVLIYFYVRELTGPRQVKLSTKQWLHFLPAFLHVSISWSLLFTDAEFQRSMFAEDPEFGSLSAVILWLFFNFFETILSMIQILIYLTLSFRLLHQHSLRIKDNFSSIEKINLNWLSSLLFGVLAIYLIWIVGSFLSDSSESGAFFDMLIGVSMVLLIYIMGYFGLRQPQIFDISQPIDNENKQSTESDETANKQQIKTDTSKYKNSPLTQELSLAILDQINQMMINDKLYLESQVSLPELAEKLGISVHYLSQTINEQLNQNFLIL
jgi:hypothetical protein